MKAGKEFGEVSQEGFCIPVSLSVVTSVDFLECAVDSFLLPGIMMPEGRSMDRSPLATTLRVVRRVHERAGFAGKERSTSSLEIRCKETGRTLLPPSYLGLGGPTLRNAPPWTISRYCGNIHDSVPHREEYARLEGLREEVREVVHSGNE